MGFKTAFSDIGMVRELTPRLFLVYTFMSIGAVNFGFDNGWWSSVLAQQQFADSFGVWNEEKGKKVLPSTWISAGSGTGNAGMAIGCMIAGPFISRVGRKNTVLAILVLAFVGMIMQNAIPSYWGIMVGRMVNAVSMGLEANNIPIFMSELSPPAIRGSLINFYQWWQIVGVILAHIVVLQSNKMWPDSQWGWRLVMVVQIIVPCLLLGIYWILPESPKWLISKGRHDDAKKSLLYIRRGAATEAEIDEEMRLTEAAVAEQEEFHHVTTYWDCFKGANGRRTLIATSVQVLQQLSGNAFMSSYAVIFLQQAGITNVFVSSLARTCMGLAGATMGFYLPDKIGRRPLFIGTAVIMWAGLWITSGVSAWWPGGVHGGSVAQGLLGLQLIWSMMSTAGWGSCVWITTAEAATAQLREKTLSIATTISFICVLLVSYINPFVQNEPGNLGAKVGFIYGSFSLIAVFWVFFMVPEMKGRSLEELDELFQNNVPVRKFRTYHATGIGAQITEISNINADPHLHITKGIIQAGPEVTIHESQPAAEDRPKDIDP